MSLQLKQLSLGCNQLRGPVLPEAWLRPGMLPRLFSLSLSGNADLTGTLPPQLAWPGVAHL
jgi:hypothetical protein